MASVSESDERQSSCRSGAARTLLLLLPLLLLAADDWRFCSPEGPGCGSAALLDEAAAATGSEL